MWQYLNDLTRQRAKRMPMRCATIAALELSQYLRARHAMRNAHAQTLRKTRTPAVQRATRRPC
eukprot:2534554-Lingulodinium_polyedra.AAC.1